MNQFPKKAEPGQSVSVQLCPFGIYEKRRTTEDGKVEVLTQVCDVEGLKAVANAFSGEVLVDFEHGSELGGSTKAAAWVQRLWVDEANGLHGTFKLTDAGAAALNSREYRYPSAAWHLDAKGRPLSLLSVALTNRPNIPVRPILNSADGSKQNVEDNKEVNMTKIAQALGLAEAATEDEILAAVKALADRNAELEKASATAEAEKLADEHKEVITNRDDFIRFAASDLNAARALVGCIATKQPEAKVVTNSKEAVPPSFASPGGKPAISDWPSALADCDGDYKAARRRHPDAYAKYAATFNQ